MIDVRQAVILAEKYFAELSTRGGILFEEVELAENGNHPSWLVTLSAPSPGSVFVGAGPPTARDYKVFKINAEDGTLESVKIRTP